VIVSVVTPADPHAAALSLATLLDIKAPDAKAPDTGKTIAFKNVFDDLALADDVESEGVSSESGASKQPQSPGNPAPDKKTPKDPSSGTEDRTVLVAPPAPRIPPPLLAKNVVLANAAGPAETKDATEARSDEPLVQTAQLPTAPVMQPVVQSAVAPLPPSGKTSTAVSPLPKQLVGIDQNVAALPQDTTLQKPAVVPVSQPEALSAGSKAADIAAAPPAVVTAPPARVSKPADIATTPQTQVSKPSDIVTAPAAKASWNKPAPLKPASASRQDAIIKVPIPEEPVSEKQIREEPVSEKPVTEKALWPGARVIGAVADTVPPQGAKIESPKSTAAPQAPKSAPTAARAAEPVETTDVATAAAPASKPAASDASPAASGPTAQNLAPTAPAASLPAPVVTAPQPAGPQPAARESNVPETQSPTAAQIPAQIPAQTSAPQTSTPKVPLLPQAENFAFAVRMMAPESAVVPVPGHDNPTHETAIESKPPVTMTQTPPAQSEPVRHEAQPAAAVPEKTTSDTREPASPAKAQQPAGATERWTEPRIEALRSDAPVMQWTEAGSTTQPAEGTESASQSLPLAAAQAHMATPELPKTSSTSEILLHLTGNDPASADIKAAIRVADRAGSVNVTVHASDPVLRESLRTNLSELSSQLANQGWKTDVVKTAAAAGQSSSQQDSHEGGQRGSQNFGGDRPQRERRGNGGQWQQEFDQQISGGDASSGGKA